MLVTLRLRGGDWRALAARALDAFLTLYLSPLVRQPKMRGMDAPELPTLGLMRPGKSGERVEKF